MYIQSPEEEKKQTNSKLMAQQVGLAENLGLLIDQVKCFEDDNETQPEKLDSQKLEKLVCQLQVMHQVAQESGNTLRDLDYTALKKVRSNHAAFGEIGNKMCFLYRYKETAQFQNHEAIFQSCSFSWHSWVLVNFMIHLWSQMKFWHKIRGVVWLESRLT